MGESLGIHQCYVGRVAAVVVVVVVAEAADSGKTGRDLELMSLVG